MLLTGEKCVEVLARLREDLHRLVGRVATLAGGKHDDVTQLVHLLAQGDGLAGTLGLLEDAVGLGAVLLNALGVGTGTGGLDVGSVIGSIAGGGIGGGVLLAIVGAIRNAMGKSA